MRLIATDYDGTLGDFDGVPQENIQAIEAWRAAGHKFGLATGRGPDMLMRELVRSKIPYDFAICSSGAAIYDQDFKQVYKNGLDNTVLKDLLDHPAVQASMHCAFIPDDGVRILVLDQNTWYLKAKLPYKMIDWAEARACRDLQQLSLSYTSKEEAFKWSRQLESDFKGQVQAFQNSISLDITAFGVSKASGVENLLQHFGWQPERILTIGDGENDLPMLMKYRGYSVPNACQSIRDAQIPLCNSVAALIEANI